MNSAISCAFNVNTCCYFCHLIDSNIRSRHAKFIAAKDYIFTPVVNRSFEPQAGDSMILLDSTEISREHTWWVVRGLPPIFPFHQPYERGLAVRRLFRVTPSREGTIHLQRTIPSLGFEPRPYGTAVSVTNHSTGWAAMLIYDTY
ncbi:hypothetical protein TNCV_2422961 [Trichonephila clavipes]|nr:hypothetical protein TNCV_2422961 [Trichonephila clavipes]